MILQALKEYYDRKTDDLPHVGWIEKGIDFSIVLRADGTLHQIDCSQENENGRITPFPSVVPNIGKQAMKHTNSGADANLLWDNSAFVLGLGNKGNVKRESFVKTIELWLGDIQDDGVSAILSFLRTATSRSEAMLRITNHQQYGEIIRSGSPTIAFRLLGDEYLFVHERPAVKEAVSRKWGSLTDNSGLGVCLVTGRSEDIETCHMVIKGVRGSQPSGATIIGFNEASFRSFSKEQGANAPVGKTSAFAYTTALNHLLVRESRQKMLVGDATAIFWAEKPADLETGMVDIFGEPAKDDPDRCVKAVRSLYQAIETGTIAVDSGGNKFYVLGLAPNASRIAIRFWIMDTVAGMAGKIVQHFDDLRIVHGSREKDAMSLFRLLVSTAVQGKSENIPPNLAGETMRAILSGLPYPQTLLQAVIRRVRAEQSAKDKKTGKAIPNVTYARASLIKACTNRKTRFVNPQIQEELKMSLDLSNGNIGYRLGRLFATLEKIQAEANPGINATIRDRFYGAASGTPGTVFSNLMRLKNHHLAKLKSEGRRVNFERLIAEIIDDVIEFPPHLSLADQGRFAIGYYHQSHDFYTKKQTNQPSNSPQVKEN
jgi:CRISPR-associated protein Csd1